MTALKPGEGQPRPVTDGGEPTGPPPPSATPYEGPPRDVDEQTPPPPRPR